MSPHITPDITVTVVLSTFNDEPYIERSLLSVLAQEGPFRYEIIVAEDCSSDGTRAVVERVLQGQEDRATAMFARRNTRGIDQFRDALGCARGEFIALADGDDYWTSREKLHKQVRFMRAHPQCSLCFHDAEFFYENGGRMPHRHNVPSPPTFNNFDRILAGNFIAGPTPMFRTEVVRRMPRRTFEIGWADWAMHIVAAQHGPIGYIDEVLAAHRIHSRGEWSRLDRIGQLASIIRFYGKIPAVLDAPPLKTIRTHRFRYAESLAGEAAREWTWGHRARSIYGWGFLARYAPRAILHEISPFRPPAIHRRAALGRRLAGALRKRTRSGAPVYEGYLDGVDGDRIAGWAWNAAQPSQPVEVEIRDGDDLVARVRADKFRPDLLDAGKGDGHHGFLERLPDRFRDGRIHDLRVAVLAAGAVLSWHIRGRWRGGAFDADVERQVDWIINHNESFHP